MERSLDIFTSNFKRIKLINNLSLLIFIILIIASPFWCVITFFFLSFTKNQNLKKKNQLLLITALSYYLALVLSTANLSGDMMIYKELFISSNDTGFIQFFKTQRKEILYSIYSFLLSKLTNGAFDFYVGFTVFIMYFIFFKSIVFLSKKHLLETNKANTIILLIGFFPPLFHLNGIIFRQNLALFILFFGFSYFEKKSFKLLLTALIASLFHYIAFPIFLLSLFKKSIFKIKNLVKIFISFFFIYNYGFLFLEFLSYFSESFKYLFLRIVRYNVYDNFDNSSVEKMIVPILFFLFQLFISIITYFKKKSFFSFLYLKYSILFLSIYIFVDYNVLEYRLILINYFFIPFVIIEFLEIFSKKVKNNLYSILIIFTPIYLFLFFSYLFIRNVPNLYKDTIILLTNPFF